MWQIFVTVSLLLSSSILAQPDSRTIFQYLQDEHFTRLVELIYGANLQGQLMDTNGLPITLFAPTNQAFESVPPEVMLQISTNSTLLRSILNGHVSPETIFGFFIRDGVTKPTNAGTTFLFNAYSNGVKTVNGAVLGKEMTLANGVVFSINKFLLPVTNPISTLLARDDSDFQDLADLLIIAGLYNILSAGGPYTLFAPTDAAFASIDASLITNTTALKEVLLNHVVARPYWSASLTDGMTLTTLGGSQITIGVSGGGVSVNGQVHVTKADIAATNGVIHIINHVIM